MDLESLWCSPEGFGVTTSSPCQRALCRIADGLPLAELACDPDVQTFVGGPDAIAQLPSTRPAELDIIAAIRTGKSRFAAALGVRASQTCEVGHLAPGEIPRVSIVSLTVDLASVVFEHLTGAIYASPALRSLLVEEPKGDSLLLRHPSGRAIEVKVVAGARAGASLVARWSAGAIFDEKPRMLSAADAAVVNFDDCRNSVIGRLLPGAQIISIGSPWAPFGPAYDAVKNFFGKPSADHVVLKGTGPMLNPLWWTPERCAALKRSDGRVYRTDVLGEFCSPEWSAFDPGWIEAAQGDLEAGTQFAKPLCCLDPAKWGPDSFALMIVGMAFPPLGSENMWQNSAGQLAPHHSPEFFIVARDKDGSMIPNPGYEAKAVPFLYVHEVCELVKFSDPNMGEQMLADIVKACRDYGVTDVYSDQGEGLFLMSGLESRGLHLHFVPWSNVNKPEAFQLLQRRFKDGLIRIPKAFERLAMQLRLFQQTPNPSGGFTYKSPRSGGAAHLDMASCLVTCAMAEALGALPYSSMKSSGSGMSVCDRPRMMTD